jgi:hypothetical protein
MLDRGRAFQDYFQITFVLSKGIVRISLSIFIYTALLALTFSYVFASKVYRRIASGVRAAKTWGDQDPLATKNIGYSSLLMGQVVLDPELLGLWWREGLG